MITRERESIENVKQTEQRQRKRYSIADDDSRDTSWSLIRGNKGCLSFSSQLIRQFLRNRNFPITTVHATNRNIYPIVKMKGKLKSPMRSHSARTRECITTKKQRIAWFRVRKKIKERNVVFDVNVRTTNRGPGVWANRLVRLAAESKGLLWRWDGRRCRGGNRGLLPGGFVCLEPF